MIDYRSLQQFIPQSGRINSFSNPSYQVCHLSSATVLHARYGDWVSLGGRARAWRGGSGLRCSEIVIGQAALWADVGEFNSEESVGFDGA